MLHHHSTLYSMRVEELRAEADRERRWRAQDLANGRTPPASSPGRGRVLAARGIAAVGRGAAQVARRLDAGAAVDVAPNRLRRGPDAIGRP